MTGWRVATVGLALLLAACGSSQQGEGLNPDQINALGLGGNRSAAARPSPRTIGLDPLTPEDLASMRNRPSCMLRVGGEPVLAAAQYTALVKRYGQLKELRVDGPVGGTGGFFQNDAISVSVGRPREAATSSSGETGAAQVRLNDRRRGLSTEVDADWSCGG